MKYKHQQVDSMDHMYLRAYKMTLNHLSAHNNNNSPHKFVFKFDMRVGDRKLKLGISNLLFFHHLPGLHHNFTS